MDKLFIIIRIWPDMGNRFRGTDFWKKSDFLKFVGGSLSIAVLLFPFNTPFPRGWVKLGKTNFEYFFE